MASHNDVTVYCRLVCAVVAKSSEKSATN